ncbi:MAG: RluA family pseudouridine synthase [Spirosomaceae bacterium]|jgi:23S rRNA pseudouridine1911/1915/1917 synthase|nr:RluA family pseudouridine synthase [Spirosomataceae bacterium]
MDNLNENIDINEEDDELFEHFRVVADKGQTLMRIDKYLIHHLKNASRNRIQNAIDAESIKVNDKTVKASYKVKPFDVITVSFPHPPRETKEVLPENIPLNIIYEDEDILIVNKDAAMVVHPAFGNWTGTLVNALVYHFQNLPTHRNGEIRPGLVHRIDKGTSGLLVIAKNEYSMTFLAKQFFEHSIERTYYALIWGEPKEPKGTINAHVGRSLKDRKVTDVFPDGQYGKEAITHYEVLKNLRYVSLIKCNLETGRTHQIRAHMKYLGHPLFSDEVYGGNKILRGQVFNKYKQFVENCFEIIPHQALHAKSLGFIHPRTKKWVQFDSDLPVDFQTVLDKWEKYVSNE